MNIFDHSKADYVEALLNIREKYPYVFIHFFMSELDPTGYDKYLYNLGRDNDSRQGDPELGQEQEAHSGSPQSNQEASQEVSETRKTF